MREKCYPSFDQVAYIYVVPFVERWRRKIKNIRKQSGDEKACVFDKFISEFIIYSSLVNVIKPMEHKHRFDKSYCTEVMAKFLVERIDDAFIGRVAMPTEELIGIIESKQFTVVSSSNENPELKFNWESSDPFCRLNALLKTLYYLRCNLFHGAKEYSDNQVQLLKPAYHCLSLINDGIMDVYLDEGYKVNDVHR